MPIDPIKPPRPIPQPNPRPRVNNREFILTKEQNDSIGTPKNKALYNSITERDRIKRHDAESYYSSWFKFISGVAIGYGITELILLSHR